MTINRTHLAPCPFCGQSDAFVEQLDSDASVAICQGLISEHEACLARGPVGIQERADEEQPGYASAVREWNRRAPGAIDYSILHAYADTQRISYDSLCATVRSAILSTTKAAPQHDAEQQEPRP